MKRVPIAILASGRGSNFEAILKASRAGKLEEAEIVALVSDQPDAPALAKAKAAGVRAVVVPAVKAGGSLEERRQLHDEKLLEALRPLAPRFLVMAGYMRIVSPRLIDAFRSERGYSRIVNIHPSLLPAFTGLEGYGQAFRYGAKLAGVTVHLVDDALDSGPICAQEAFSIAGCSSEAEVEALGLAVEHELYPRALKWILPEKFEVEKRGERISVRPN